MSKKVERNHTIDAVSRWNTVKKYIVPLADLLNAEILVIDKNGFCVCGTKCYEQRLGKKIHEDSALRHSLTTGETTFVLNPGGHTLCQDCPKRDGCAEAANYIGPIIVDEQIIAVVQFVAFTTLQKEDLLSKAEQAFALFQHLIRYAWIHEMRTTQGAVEDENDYFPNFIGKSPIIQNLKKQILKIAPTDSTVLIQGESGTGKEQVARAIHEHSLRKNKPFVPINCGAIHENLMESELFGYEAGAFSGAQKNGKIGLVEQADGGTLFLDEISEMPIPLQVKLLRVLQDQSVRRVGGTTQHQVNIRVISASNKNVKQLVNEGSFRQDLFFRLDVVPLYIPPLRERAQDIRLIIAYFLQQFGQQQNRSFRMSTNLYSLFEKYSWPGNVRELKNFVEFGVTLCENDILTQNIMQSRFLEAEKNIENSPIFPELDSKSQQTQLSTSEQEEKVSIEKLLQVYTKHKAAKKLVAKNLGISPATLYRKLQKYNLV